MFYRSPLILTPAVASALVLAALWSARPNGERSRMAASELAATVLVTGVVAGSTIMLLLTQPVATGWHNDLGSATWVVWVAWPILHGAVVFMGARWLAARPVTRHLEGESFRHRLLRIGIRSSVGVLGINIVIPQYVVYYLVLTALIDR